MSFKSCARNADIEARSTGNLVRKLCLSEAQAWCKMAQSLALFHQSESDSMKLELDKQNRLCKDLSRRLDILQKKYEVSEGHTGTLIKEKSGLTAELINAQNTIRNLYKELKQRKAAVGQVTALGRRSGRPLIAPVGLWASPVRKIPRFGETSADSTPPRSGVEVVVESRPRR